MMHPHLTMFDEIFNREIKINVINDVKDDPRAVTATTYHMQRKAMIEIATNALNARIKQHDTQYQYRDRASCIADGHIILKDDKICIVCGHPVNNK